MQVKNSLKCYETNGEEVIGLDWPVLEVISHWNFNDRVVIKFPNGNSYTVIASQLIKAINNATNKE